MEVTIQPQPERSEVALTIHVTPKEFTPYAKRAAAKLSMSNPRKGFRPGKVSLSVAQQAYGTERVLQTALDDAVRHFFVQAVLDHDVEAITRPALTIETVSLEEGLKFTATVAVLPTVTLGNVRAITITKRRPVVTQEEVTKELHYLAKMRSTPLEVARPAQTGDTVTLDFKVSQNGGAMEGGESKNHPVHLGEGHFVPDFEKKIEGMRAGEEREFKIHFPADYAQAALRGQEATVWVKAHAVQKRIIPALDDQFAQNLGKFSSLQQLQETLQENLQREKEHKEQDRFHGELAEKLAESATFGPLPEILIEREIDQRLAEFSQMLAYQQKTVDDYLQEQQKKLNDIRQELQPAAEKAVKIGLAMRAFARHHKIDVTEAEVNEEVNRYLKRYPTPEAARKKVDIAELKDNLSSTLRNQKVFQKLTELTHVTTADQT
ncbi:MAG: trigger factor [Candidatus Andersenbacteria bacterium]